MRPRIPEDKRAAILEDIKSGEKARSQIAEDHAVSTTSVSKIAHDAGITDAFSRTQTKNATEAAQADNAASRARLAERFLEEAHRALDDLHKPHMVFSFGGKDNLYNEHEFSEPPPADKRNLMIIAATAADKHMAIDKHASNTQGLSAVDEWIAQMLGKS